MFCAVLSNCCFVKFLGEARIYWLLGVQRCLCVYCTMPFSQKKGQTSLTGYRVLIFLFLLFISGKKTRSKYALQQ